MIDRHPILAITVLLILQACASDDPNRRAKIGAGVGAVTGAVIGHQFDHGGGGAIVGGLVGAAAGGLIGNYMDEQEQDFNRQLAEEQRRKDLEIERLKDDTLKLSLNSEVSFDLDRAEIKSTFRPTLDKLADILRKYDRTVVHIVGFTDSTGSAEYNQQLSERRADSVARYLESDGVPPARIRTEGRGESEPRATNATAAGRQLNRRVEIYIKPVVEGDEEKAYESPRYY